MRQVGDALRTFFARRVAAADVDDLLQDCYLKVSQGLPGLQDRERVTAWVFRIARNLVVDHLRSRQRELLSGSWREDPTSRDGAGTPDLHTTVASWIGHFVDQLPQKYAEVVRLSELQGLSHRAIADRLGISVSGIKSRVQRGRAQLRSKLLACCSFEFDRRGRIVGQRRNAPGGCDC